MRKKTRSYSIIIVSDALTTSKEFVISKKFIRNALVAISLLVLVFGYVIFDYLTKYINISLDNKENESLKIERKENLEKIDTLTANLKNYEVRLKRMEEMKEKIMIIAGLSSAYKIREVGVGGSAPTPSANLNANPGINNQVINTENIKEKSDKINFNKINSDSIKTEKDLEFVLNVIKQQKTQLASMPTVWPCRGYVTSTFGYRMHPFTGKREFHNGIDISSQLGYDVKATGAGYVLITESRGYMGKMIIIDHGYGWTTRYGHLADYNVKEGQKVKRGQVIGFIGNTGRSTAPHLHYEVRVYEKPHNPLDFILD